MELIAHDDDFNINQDMSDDSTILPIETGSKEKKPKNNNHGSNEVVVLTDSDEECITLNDEGETSNSDVKYVTINNIVVHCISVNSCIEIVDGPGNVTDEKHQKKTKVLHSRYTRNRRQKRNVTFKNDEKSQKRSKNECVTLNNDENECIILNDCDYLQRKRNKNNVELVSFNNVEKLVTLDDKNKKHATSNSSESIQSNLVTLSNSKNLISLVKSKECVSSINDDSITIDQQLVQSNDRKNTTEELITLNDNCEESVIRVKYINITIEKFIHNEVEKCILKNNEECMKNGESIQKYANSDGECIYNVPSDEEGIVSKKKDNQDENTKNKGCSINLYDSEFTVEEGFTQNVNNSSNTNQSSGEILECQLCAYKSTSVNGLLDHLASHPLSEYFYCSMCKYKCKYKGTLEAHVIAEHTNVKMLQCPLCHYRCLEETWLQKHLENHKKNTKV